MNPKPNLRRNLIKGALAAPAIFTVRTASAQAVGSATQCLLRDAQKAALPPRPAALTAVDNDDWVRMRLNILQLSMYQGAALKTLPGKYFLGADRSTYWRINEGRAGLMGAATSPLYLTATRTSYSVGQVVSSTTGETRYALVYFDNTGAQTGFALERGGGNALTASCLTSIRPGAAI